MAATKAQLYEEAQALDIEGRSEMTKRELKAAIETARAVEEAEKEAEIDDFLEEVEEVEEPDFLEEIEEELEVRKVVAPVDLNPPAPAVSQEPTIQGGLTFLTDRAQ